jgi:hypothetical protein
MAGFNAGVKNVFSHGVRADAPAWMMG